MRCWRMRCWDIWRCWGKASQPVWPTIEFVDWDIEINVWEIWTLRFRYTNAASFSGDADYPPVANVTNISSDEEYCYVTYEWVSGWACYITATAWNGDINTTAWAQVNVIGPTPVLEPITAISQFSTDYTTIAGKYAMRNLWTVTPSEGADVNSIARGMEQGLNVEETRIENWTLYAVVYGDEWDWDLNVTLQNWNSYIYTFHIQPNIPVESIEEHFAYNIEVPVWGATTVQFSYLPTNATNFDSVSWTNDYRQYADLSGLREDNWTLYLNVIWIEEWTWTIVWALNDVPFTTINFTVSATPVTPTLSFVEIRDGVYWQCIFASNPEWAEHNEQVEISDEDMYWQSYGYLPCTLTLSVDPTSSIDLSDVTFSAHQYWWRDDWGTYEYMDVDNDWYDFYDFSYQWNWLREFKTYNWTWWTARVTLTATSNTNPNVSVSLNCLIQAPMMDEPPMD